MNKVILKGNLTRDPETRTVNANGRECTVTNFGVAVSRYFKKSNGQKGEDTNFFNCEAWDTGADLINTLLSKGDPVLLECSLND